ncbi:unnamed protein product [Clonostachys rosea]|uniref:Hsp90 chaperone protein kinase-targeting subunit n=1 Tax=Bionectria ochroleuca TaxID=29856 RepID=A0ABY6UCQ5_BIOOC|nr:unnamed protein product [Clonostachys rosea]
MDVRSKWDGDDLSDDSDTELHPHIDERSLIWKYRSLTRDARHELEFKIADRRYEKMVREKVVNWLSLVEADLEPHFDEYMDSSRGGDRVRNAIYAIYSGSEGTRLLPRLSNGKCLTSYNDMFREAVCAGFRKADDTVSHPESWIRVYITELRAQKQNVQQQLMDVTEQLEQLKKEDAPNRKCEAYQLGFANSIIIKNDPGPCAGSEWEDACALPDEQDLWETRLSPLSRHFAVIHPSDYRLSHQLIKAYPAVLHASEIDGIMAHAFNTARYSDDAEVVRAYVHQASILQYCLELGPNGAEIFFRGMSKPKSKAHVGFQREVYDKFTRLLELAAISKEYCEEMNKTKGAKIDVQPNKVYNISVPESDSGDKAERERREIFDEFNDDMKAAIQSGSLDKINDVLGAMPVEPAEAVKEMMFEIGCIKV